MQELKIQVAQLPRDWPEIQFIRRTVFQLEQKVDEELDFDGQDAAAEHLVAYVNGQPVGTTRIRYLDAQTAKLERLAILQEFRRQGLGRQLMQTALELLQAKTVQFVQVHAQEYVQDLYQSLGFAPVGDRFTEAGISHIKMQKTLSAPSAER